MGDVADILGVQKKKGTGTGIPTTATAEQAPGPSSASALPKHKKPHGMSREVFALMGEQGLPSIMPSRSAAGGGFKQKRAGATGPARWELRPFTNSARSDPSWGVLKLKHWQPATCKHSSAQASSVATPPRPCSMMSCWW